MNPAGGAVQQNGQTPAEIQEEVALTSVAPAGNNKRHSTHDKLHFPRAGLQAITALGTVLLLCLFQFVSVPQIH